MSIEEARFSVLGYDQVVRLQELLEEPVSVQGRGNFPALETRLRDLVQRVRSQLDRQGVPVRDVRLNGGAASYVLEPDTSAEYNDLDVIFGCELGSSGAGGFERVKTAVLDALAELLPAGVKRINACALKEAYLHKLVKVATDEDRWSLVSLSNSLGRNVELKFVHRMRRQFEFSVDSFQIVVDPLLLLHQCGGGSAEALLPRCTQDFFPSVLAESVYGNFGQALEHLRRRLIATRNPEEIRGGGLLKYCHLLARGFHATDSTRALERYMCSRFFIDFPEIQAQRAKLHSFLANHLSHERLRYSFLATLYRVVDGSTVCLMGPRAAPDAAADTGAGVPRSARAAAAAAVRFRPALLAARPGPDVGTRRFEPRSGRWTTLSVVVVCVCVLDGMQRRKPTGRPWPPAGRTHARTDPGLQRSPPTSHVNCGQSDSFLRAPECNS
ncbi:hypothetical protein MRX96_018295 [Rhipicephalus microplus]